MQSKELTLSVRQTNTISEISHSFITWSLLRQIHSLFTKPVLHRIRSIASSFNISTLSFA